MSKKLTIVGVSDDYVKIKGLPKGEIEITAKQFHSYLVFSCLTVIRAEYSPPTDPAHHGKWLLEPYKYGDSSIVKSIRVDSTNVNKPAHSDLITIELRDDVSEDVLNNLHISCWQEPEPSDDELRALVIDVNWYDVNGELLRNIYDLLNQAGKIET